MPRLETVHECQSELQHLFPDLSRPIQKSLAACVCGVVWSGSCTLNRIAASLPLAVQLPSIERRFQRLLANPGLEVARCQEQLAGRVLARRRGRLDLLLDATTTGTSAQQRGSQSLVLALAEQGRAIPLSWQCWQADAAGQNWGQAQEHLFAQIEAVRPADSEVVVMTDRGLSGAPLVARLQSHGWHYLLRVIRTTRIQRTAGHIVEIGELAPAPGTASFLTGVKVYAPRSKPHERWISDWDQAVTTNVVAVWPAGAREAWLLVTDLPATRQRCQEYRQRTWEEELFRDLKSVGWGWQRSRVRDPERVARLVLILALATLWMLALGQRVIRRGWRRQLEAASRRCFSRFQLGRHWVARRLAHDHPPPPIFHLYPLTYTFPKLS